MVAFDYKHLAVDEMRAVTRKSEKTGKDELRHMEIDGEPLAPSKRFWHSLFSRFSFGSSIFRYFDHEEVFDRIKERGSDSKLRLCVERPEEGEEPSSSYGGLGGRLVGVSSPNSPMVTYDELQELLGKFGGDRIEYDDGVVSSTHDPSVKNRFDVGGDLFHSQFVLNCPIDGYGSPHTYLSLLRMICSNGMIGMAPAFRTNISLGRGSSDADVRHTLGRVLDGFNSDGGFAAMRQRLQSSTSSWLSVREYLGLREQLIKHHSGGQLTLDERPPEEGHEVRRVLDRSSREGSPVAQALDGMAGDPSEIYGFANLEGISSKKQQTLPVNCRVYDAINLATEIATHYSEPAASRALNAWVGQTIKDEYDLEGTQERMPEFKDFHVHSALAGQLSG